MSDPEFPDGFTADEWMFMIESMGKENLAVRHLPCERKLDFGSGPNEDGDVPVEFVLDAMSKHEYECDAMDLDDTPDWEATMAEPSDFFGGESDGHRQ
jgi:hypothetical protein